MSVRSSSQPTDFGKFHNTIEEMFDNLKRAYPDDTDLEYYRDQHALARRANARGTVEMFVSLIETKIAGTTDTYIDYIMNMNEKFFLDNVDSVANVVDAGNYVKGDIRELINKVKSLWLGMSADSKNSLWRYFQVLVTLAVKATKRQDLVDVLNRHRKAQGKALMSL